ncbi:MAG TPA: Hpt domain-containing protein [Myxococcota bacterium]|nr:Hpt domain-containing protein [Myxococcota bacterium]
MAGGREVDAAVLRRLATAIGGEGAHEVIDAYLDDAPNRLADFRRGLEASDLELARRAAHTLKSTAASLGAKGFAELCDEAEAAARVGDAIGLRALLPQLDARLSRVLEELRRAAR